MDSRGAAQQMADLINKIESAHLLIELSSGEVRIGSVRVVVGDREGDPWTVERDY